MQHSRQRAVASCQSYRNSSQLHTPSFISLCCHGAARSPTHNVKVSILLQFQRGGPFKTLCLSSNFSTFKFLIKEISFSFDQRLFPFIFWKARSLRICLKLFPLNLLSLEIFICNNLFLKFFISSANLPSYILSFSQLEIKSACFFYSQLNLFVCLSYGNLQNFIFLLHIYY